MKLVLEGDSLANIVDQAQKLVEEYGGEATDAAPATEAAPAAPKRGRGRPAKAAAAPAAATEAPVQTQPWQTKEEAQKVAAAQAQAKPSVSKEAFLAAATKLIEVKGEDFAAALLAKSYAPHARFSEIPQSRWAELVAEVDFILSQKEEAPAVPEKKSLI